MREPSKAGRLVFRGVAASQGVGRGKLFVLARPRALVVERRPIRESDFANEILRLQQALLLTRQQLGQLQEQVGRRMGNGDAQIFDAQLLVLDDPYLHDEVVQLMKRDLICIEAAFQDFAQRYLTSLSSVEDPYLSERAVDLRDVADRVLHNLVGQDLQEDLSHLREPCIVVAYDLTPSQTATLDRKLVVGFATEQGSATSHTAILARSLQIPAVTGLTDAIPHVRTGETALLDGFGGNLVVEPTEQTLYEYGQLEARQEALQGRLREIRAEPATTPDGLHVVLSANIEGPQEIADVLERGAEGVGLLRTEYLFLNRRAAPDEEEQFEAYRQVAAALAPAPVIIRTLDLGGDKMPQEDSVRDEQNPFLGWRAIRISLQEQDLFCAQLRAILRASAHGNVKLMYPMISGIEELVQANALLNRCKADLRARGQAYDETMEVGAMIEIPSAVIVADALARRVQFFSIGTNDLIQYSLAVDRLNPRIAHLYDPTHPAVVRLIKQTMDTAHAHGLWCGVCGEMAGEPVLTPLLIGLGADELSTAPGRVPGVKYVIRRLDHTAAQTLADFALRCEDSEEILARCRSLTQSIAPRLFES